SRLGTHGVRLRVVNVRAMEAGCVVREPERALFLAMRWELRHSGWRVTVLEMGEKAGEDSPARDGTSTSPSTSLRPSSCGPAGGAASPHGPGPDRQRRCCAGSVAPGGGAEPAKGSWGPAHPCPHRRCSAAAADRKSTRL